MIEYVKDDAVKTIPLGFVFLCGSVGRKFDKVIFERISSPYAHEKIFGEAESAFEKCEDDANAPLGMWRGEFWGKQIISACRCCRYNGDVKLKNFIRSSVNRVLSLRRSDGYLGTYKNERQIFRASVKEVQRITGWNWECDWTWNIWCRKYTLWGLLEAYELLGDEEILSACENFANQLIDMLDDMQAKICETGTFFGLPSGSVMKPMLILYRQTGNKKYLNFALEIASEWKDNSTRCCKIIKCALEDKPIHLWNYDTNDINAASKGNCGGLREKRRYEDSHKAYEMMSCFDGLCELYRITGDEEYYSATVHFWNLLIKYEYNPLFSVGYNDIFINAANYQTAITELCDVIHFMRLAGELYKLSGNAMYLDYFEAAFYNPFMAGVTRDGTWGARGVRGIESNMYDNGQSGFVHNHCCVDNMPRGFANMAELAAAQKDGDLYINFYNCADVNFDGAKIHISDGYLQNLQVRIDVESDRERLLYLRIPSWSQSAKVTVGTELHEVGSGKYFAIAIRQGITNIVVDFDKTVRLIKGDYNYKFFPITEYMKSRYISSSAGVKLHDDAIIADNRARVCVGPSLLALSRDFGASVDDIKKNHGICAKSVTAVALPEPNLQGGADAVFNVSFYTDNGDFTLKMCNFSSAADIIEYEDFRYTIFI